MWEPTRRHFTSVSALAALIEFADAGTPLHPGAQVWDDARAAIEAAKVAE